MRALRLAVVVAVALAPGCSSCGKKKGETAVHDQSVHAPEAKPGQPLELEPLPEPPAVHVAPGSIAGIPKGPVAVVVARPQGEARNGERPAVTFNKPLVSLGDRDAAKPPPVRIAPAVAGAWKWIGSSSIEFAPDHDLPYATRYQVTVDAGLTAVDGEKLPQPYSFSFTTLKPRVTGSEPRDGWKWLAPDQKIGVIFNQPMAADFDRHVALEVDGRAVPYTFTVVDEEAERAKKEHRAPAPRSPWGRSHIYWLAPKMTLPKGAKVTVVVDGKLAGAEGPLTAPARTLTFHVAGPFSFTAVRACTPWNDRCPYGPIVLQATNEPDLDSLKGKIHFDPPALVDEDDLASQTSLENGATATVGARFRPGTTYTVTVDAGAKDLLGQTAPAFKGKFRLDDVEPDLNIDSPFALIEAKGGDQSYPVEAVNIKRVHAWVQQLTPSQMARVLGDKPGAIAARVPNPSEPITVDVDTSTQKNVAVRKPLALGKMAGAAMPKLFRIAFTAPEIGVDKRWLLAQVTDLDAHAKLGATSGVVWVTSLSKGTPVPGATVKLYDTNGTELFTAVTDVDGIAKVKGVADLVKNGDEEDRWYTPQILVSAEKDGDTGVSFSTWSGEIGPGASGVDEDWDGDRPRALGTLVTERGIYRPGDEVYLKGILRLRKRGQISTPKLDSDVEIDVEARGKQIAKQKVPLTRFGTFSTKVKLPEGGALGWHQVTANAVVNGEPISLSTSFRVEEYRAPHFKVDVKADKPALIAGEHVTAHVDARYLFGGAMPGAEVQATLMRETTEFAPEGYDGYQFGPGVWGFDDEEPQTTSDVAARTTAHIADDGTLALDMGEAEPIAGRPTLLTVEAEVADVSRQRVANRATVTVHPASVYAGVKLGDGFGDVDKPLPLQMVAVALDGKLAGGVPLKVSVKRREWKSIKKKDPDTGRFVTLSEPQGIAVATCDKVSDAGKPVSCEVKPDKPGLYVVDVTATDGQGRTSKSSAATYVVGGGWVSWQRTDGETLEIVADRKKYAPGDTAHVLVKSPWPDAEALVTVEREGVVSVSRQKVGPGTAVAIPIDEAAVPDVFVSVVVVRGRIPAVEAVKQAGRATKEIDPGRPQVRVGYARLNVEKKSKRLAVTVDTGPGPHRPGDKTKIALRVKDSDGRGVTAEIAVWAVDEAVLRLTGYALPDPVEAIHPERGLSVRLGEPIIFLVKKQGYGEKGRPPGGGGGGGGGGFRSTFKTTAFFVPSVVTDEHGKAEVEVQLPDDLTTYRVMAVAVTEGDQAGAGKADLVVNKPLLALPALPRLARVGDRFSAGVVVHAVESGDVDVKAAVDGLSLDEPATKTIHVEAGRATEVRFQMSAKDPGRARLRFEVSGGGERDGVEQFLPVVLPMVEETVAASGDVGGAASAKSDEALAPPKDVYPAVGGLDVTLASTALAGFQEAMEQLVEYPYGCAEQLSSRLVPFLAVRELEGTFGVPHKGSADPAEEKRMAKWLGLDVASAGEGKPVDPDTVARQTVSALEDLQGSDGGFRYWGSSTCSDPWASSYATLALARAKELGYGVDADAVTRGQKFLADKVAADKLPVCSAGFGGGSRHATPVERAFAVWVLARTGQPKNSFLEGLYQERRELPLFAKAMLADASFIGAKRARSAHGSALLQEVMNGAKETARDVHFEETDPGRWSRYWSSNVRTSAIVLMTLVDAEPEHPFVHKISSWLLTAKKGGRYQTTQDAAFALMAMSEVVRAKERTAPDFTATVSLGAKNLVDEKLKGRNLDVVTKHVAMKDLGGDAAKLTFAKNGAGTLSYTASLSYAKKDMPTAPLDAGIAVQRWFEPWSAAPGSGQAHRVRAGELVRLRVRVASSAERKFVAVDVPIPAGLEIVDESLASTARLPGGEEGGEGEEGEGEEGEGEPEPSLWTPFNHVELRDDRAVFFADDLPPGVHTATVAARATTAGVFVLKPATAEEMYAPETSGRSDGGTFEVVAEPSAP